MANLRKFFKGVDLESFESRLSQKIFKNDLSILIVVLAICVYTITFSYCTIMKYYGFRTYAWDLGIFNQAFWTTLHNGKFFYTTVELVVNPSGSFFGIHVSPILFLLVPIYAVYPNPVSLLVIQTFVLALGAIPLYKIAVDAVKYRAVGLTFAVAYLLNPLLHGINWFDFHVQSFLPLFLLTAFLFFERHNWKRFFVFIFLSLMCEEHVVWIVLFIGIFVLLQNRNHLKSVFKTKKFRDDIFLVSVITFILAISWYIVVQLIRGYFPIDPNFVSTFLASSNWEILGVQNPAMIPLQIILNPAKALAALNYDFLAKIGYIIISFVPLAFRPFFKLRYLLPTFPWFVYALLSNYKPYYDIFNQYPAYIITFIFIAAVFAIKDKMPGKKIVAKHLVATLTLTMIAVLIVSPLSPILTMLYPDIGLENIGQRDMLIHQVLGYLPSDASIITQNNLFPQVSSRINAYVVPIAPIWSGNASKCVDYIVGVLKKVEYVLVDIESDPSAASTLFSLLQNDYGFRVFVSADGVILFKKDFTGYPVILETYNVKFDYTSLTLYDGEIIQDPDSSSQMVLHRNVSSENSPIFWYGPRGLMPPGEYNVTLKLKSRGAGELFTVDICSDEGQKILFSKTFQESDFPSQDKWTNFTFHLSLNEPLIDFEARAVNVLSDAEIYLDYIIVNQMNN